MSSVSNNNYIVQPAGTPKLSAADVGQAGSATQGVISQMQSIEGQVGPLNDSIQSNTASLGTVNQEIADLQNKQKLSPDQQTQLQGLYQQQQSMMATINAALQELKELQKQLQQLMSTKLPEAAAKDKAANDEKAKSQQQQLADQAATQAAATAAMQDAQATLNSQLSGQKSSTIQAALQALNVSKNQLTGSKKSTNPSASSEYNQYFGSGSGYNDWSGLSS